MNKLLIVLLAVCLVNVHAFVKREAATEKSTFDFKELGSNAQEQFEKLGDQIKKSLDPEAIKKGLNELLAGIDKALKPANEKKE